MDKAFLHSIAGIHSKNHDPRIKDWASNMAADNFTIQDPQYKELIQGVPLRRLGGLLRTALACSQTLVNELGTPDGIIVSTGLGCLTDTKKFLLEIAQYDNPSPTSFIHSTHNTVAGQLGLHLKCHGYNVTHTNLGACLEMGILDATLQKDGWYLVGGIDENIDWLYQLASTHTDDLKPGFGAHFMAVSNQPSEVEIAEVRAVRVDESEQAEMVKGFLKEFEEEGAMIFTNKAFAGLNDQSVDYSQHSGAYVANSGFGIEMAWQHVKETSSSAVVINANSSKEIGLTLLRHA